MPSLREQLLSAGVETFHRRGYNATSVQDITDAAGAPKGSFYNHFESKEVLAAEVVRSYRVRGRKRLGILQEGKLSPLRRLRRYFESLNDAAADGGFSAGCLLGNFGAEMSAQSPLIRKELAESFARWCGAIAVVIGEAQKGGSVSRSVPANELADSLVHAWEGAMLRAKVEKSRAPLDLFLKVTFARTLV
jgi:TetR/AcrR family transcriptional repressor of nem operon